MTHEWMVTLADLDAATVTAGRQLRDARVASEHGTIIPHDDTLYDQAIVALQILAGLGGNVSDIRIEAGCSDEAHLAPFIRASLRLSSGASYQTVRSWQASAMGQLTVAEETLARAAMSAQLAAQGRSATPDDTGVLDALIFAARGWLLSLAPSATLVRSEMSASISDGSHALATLHLSIVVSEVTPPDTLPNVVLTPPAIAANVNNYAPAGLDQAAMLRLTGTAARNITGLAGGIAMRHVTIVNVGSFSLTLVNASASSLAANRFLLGANLVLAANASATLIYDTVSGGWRRL